MSRHIPSKKALTERLWPALVNTVGYDRANAALKVVRNLLVAWRDGLVSSRDMLEEANTLIHGHGVEHLRSRNGNADAYYVNRGETYSVTLLLDTSKDRVWLTSWGAWVEAEERQGNSFEGLDSYSNEIQAAGVSTE